MHFLEHLKCYPDWTLLVSLYCVGLNKVKKWPQSSLNTALRRGWHMWCVSRMGRKGHTGQLSVNIMAASSKWWRHNQGEMATGFIQPILYSMYSMKIVIPSHFILWKKKNSKRCYDTTMLESIHTKDESKLRFSTCFHLWCELTTTINVTEWQVSWISCHVNNNITRWTWFYCTKLSNCQC